MDHVLQRANASGYFGQQSAKIIWLGRVNLPVGFIEPVETFSLGDEGNDVALIA